MYIFKMTHTYIDEYGTEQDSVVLFKTESTRTELYRNQDLIAEELLLYFDPMKETLTFEKIELENLPEIILDDE